MVLFATFPLINPPEADISADIILQLGAITGREQMQQIAGLFDHLIGERE